MSSEINTLESLSPFIDAIPRLDAQAVLHMGHDKLYRLLRKGKLDAVKDGPRTLITVASIRRYQAARPRATYLPPAPEKNNFADLNRRRRERRARSRNKDA